ncbi:splicing regulator SDE2 [Rhynchophorus ferrugineus]|uniref:splicing regulator SDE2 n=1 Tax=Rhynchophorus ferrugineus TaxID=354439 RepID=UPI003FCD025B
MDIVIGKHNIITLDHCVSFDEIQSLVGKTLHLRKNEFYLMSNGRLMKDGVPQDSARQIDVVLSTLGGKGGFGSMLRAIGAQIEKTTNREACRDLSGRRLRDINEEQRLKKWVAQQAEREKEAKERKQKKLEKLCEQPKHEFNDKEYDKERSVLPEKVEDAVIKGLEVSSKRKPEEKTDEVPRKKKKLWLDDELDDLDSSEDISDDDTSINKKEDSSSNNSANEESCSVSNNNANVDVPEKTADK